MVSRVATYPFTSKLIGENMRLQARYGDINEQISSGLKSQDYKGIAKDSQYLLSVESSVSKLKTYNANATSALSVINTMYSTMNGVQDLANSMITVVTASLGGNQLTPAVIQSQASNAMQELTGLLNFKMGGKYIFSGTDVDTSPVNLSDPAWTAQTSPSSANSSYYQGNAGVLSVQVSETHTINYGITANNTAFEKMFRAFNLMYNNASNATALTEASALLASSIDSIANLQGVLGNNTKSIDTQADKNDIDRTYLTELISNTKETDIPSASVRLTEIQSQLEASYAASVRLLRLNLSSYL